MPDIIPHLNILVACILAYLALRTFYVAMMNRLDDKKPKIAVWIEPGSERIFDYYFVVSNYSSNPAFNVKLKPAEDIFLFEKEEGLESKLKFSTYLGKKMSVLPPNYQRRVMMGEVPGPFSNLKELDFDKTLDVEISWQDEYGKSFSEIHTIDWRLIPAIHVERGDGPVKDVADGISGIGQHLNNISENLKTIESQLRCQAHEAKSDAKLKNAKYRKERRRKSVR